MPQDGFDFRDAARCFVYDQVHVVAREHDAGNAARMLKLLTDPARVSRGNRENAFAEAGFKRDGGVAEEQLALVQKSNAVATLGFIKVGR